MKKGFTIIELLVASLLLGLLVTILTMIFNQSSIAWRTGVAAVTDIDDVCDNVAELREEADNAFIAKEGGSYKVFRHIGLWNSDGKLRNRSCDASDLRSSGRDTVEKLHANILRSKVWSEEFGAVKRIDQDFRAPYRAGAVRNDNSFDNYMVNVMSAGPDKEFDTWDDIWSSPDDFE